MTFFEELQQQRWDDHRYYHHNRINQFLHFLSAICFSISYVLIFFDPVTAVMIGWLLAMVLRQTGHFFFEPKTYDEVNQVTHEYKESVKVGYNLKRKVVLLSLWVLVPVILYFDPTFFAYLDSYHDVSGFLHNTAILWLILGASALVFRTVHLFFIMGVQSGLVWFTKILTDPYHDMKIYYKSLYYIIKGQMYDENRDWYKKDFVARKA